jgi:hypothetical protein
MLLKTTLLTLVFVSVRSTQPRLTLPWTTKEIWKNTPSKNSNPPIVIIDTIKFWFCGSPYKYPAGEFVPSDRELGFFFCSQPGSQRYTSATNEYKDGSLLGNDKQKKTTEFGKIRGDLEADYKGTDGPEDEDFEKTDERRKVEYRMTVVLEWMGDTGKYCGEKAYELTKTMNQSERLRLSLYHDNHAIAYYTVKMVSSTRGTNCSEGFRCYDVKIEMSVTSRDKVCINSHKVDVEPIWGRRLV